VKKQSDKKLIFYICLTLVLATSAVYYQVYSYEFVNFDDPVYVFANPNIRTGLTLTTIKWAFTAGYAGNWHPLTWLSHALDWQLFGSDPAGHHITNLIFHIASTLLLFIVLKQMTGALWPSAFVAALFALHPLHVESVAWVAERKDVLSTFFWLLTMWAYVRFVSRPRIWRYLLVLVFFALGLMSKPMLVTLPFVLLLLDYWPLERIGSKGKKAGSKRSLVYLVIEKIPLFAMVLASSVVTFIVQRKGRELPLAGEGCGFLVRLANASISYLQYITRMIWPARLAVFYPHPGQNISFLYAAISAVLLLAVTIVILRFAKNRRYLFTGWFWYLGTLVPVIGIVQVGYQAMADRYTYITLTGLFIIIAWGASELFEKWHYRKVVLRTSSLIILSALAICTSFQLRYWRSDVSLFRHALKVTENNYLAHLQVATFLYAQREFDQAIREYQKALKIAPANIEVLQVFCDVLIRQGRDDEAVKYLTQALQIKPDLHEARTLLGSILAKRGEFDEAIKHYRIVAEAMDKPQTYWDLGYELSKFGRYEEAEIELRKVLLVTPDEPNLLNDLGAALYGQKKFDEAIAYFNQVLEIDPNHTAAKKNLAVTLVGKQNFQSKDIKDTAK